MTRKRTREPKAGKPILTLARVSVRVRSGWILRDVNWTVRAGENWVVLGPNGSGKTTLLALIQGDHPQAYANEIQLFGRRLGPERPLWEWRRYLGVVSNELHMHFPPEATVWETVASGWFDTLGTPGRLSPVQGDGVAQSLRAVGLLARRSARFASLASGEQRLALLARAWVKRPRLFLLDEPCQGLGAAETRRVLEEVDRLTKDGAQFIYVSHYRCEIPRHATHVLQLKHGRVMRQCPVGRRSLPR